MIVLAPCGLASPSQPPSRGLTGAWAGEKMSRNDLDYRAVEALTEAVGRLRHLYQSQVILLAIVLLTIALTLVVGVFGR